MPSVYHVQLQCQGQRVFNYLHWLDGHSFFSLILQTSTDIIRNLLHVEVKSRQAYILIINMIDHCFFPPLAGLFTLILETFTSRMMQHELNMELDNSRDKPDKKQVWLSFRGELYSKHKKLG